MTASRTILVVAVLCSAGTARGQAIASKEPSGTHIFPAGGQRGTVVPVRVGCECLPPGGHFHLRGDGVTAPDVLGPRVQARFEPNAPRLPLDANFVNYSKEWASEIKIAPDAPLGPAFWRVTTGWGGTQLRPFLVGDLPEFIESEPNSVPSLAQRIQLPVVVNGQIAGERDIDYFTLGARAGETVVCDVMAARIGSPLEPILQLRDAHGRQLRGDEVRIGNDPVLAFRIPQDGDYSMLVANLGQGGGPEYVYRITVSTRPYAYSAFPASGTAGQTHDVEFLTLTGTGTPRALTQKVTFPTGQSGLFWHRGDFAVNPILLTTTDLSTTFVPGAKHTGDMATALTAPVVVNGRFLTDTAEDWYRFHARQGQAFTIDCRPFPPGSPSMPQFALEDATGAIIARGNGMDAPGQTSVLEWRAPSDGEYRLRLRDLQYGSHSGPDFVYLLTVRPAEPDFALTLVKDFLNVTQGTREEAEVVVTRTGGFTGPVQLNVTDLPPGVRVENTLVPENALRQRIAFVAAADARPVDGAVRITGTAKVAEKKIERTAVAIPLGLDSPGLSPAATAIPELQLTVQHKPIFNLTCSEAYQYAHSGTIYPYRMRIERLDGFNGEIHIQICDRQVQDLDGVEVVEQVIPRGVKEFDNLIYFPETMHAGVQHHSRPYVQAFASFTDRWGQKQTLLAVSNRRCMVRTRPPVAKLRAAEDSATAHAGSTVECKLALDRTSNFQAAAQVSLVEAPPGVEIQSSTATIPAGQNAAVVKVVLGPEVSKNNSPTLLKFRASGRLADGSMLVSEAIVRLKWD
jgi:hypothetical protein